MRVLVSDASILIELAKWSLLEALFKLPFEFAVPDALYEDELIDLGEIDREQLKGLGLRVESLDAEGMARAVTYQTARPKLTLHDCLAVTLAVTNDWPLLTGDKRMRALADEEHLEVHGVLWVIDRVCRAPLNDMAIRHRSPKLSHPVADTHHGFHCPLVFIQQANDLTFYARLRKQNAVAAPNQLAHIRVVRVVVAHNKSVKPTFIPLRFIHAAYLQRYDSHSRHPRRVPCQSDKRVPKLNGRCIRFPFPQRRLVRRFSSLVMESNLMRACRPFPAQLQRRIVAAVVEPCRFSRPVSVGALPHLTNPSAINAPLPSNASGRGQPMRGPCVGFCRVLQNPTESANGLKRGSKASVVVAGAVMLATPPLVIDRRKRAPQLARRVRNDRPRPTVLAGIALFRPSVNAWQSCIASVLLYENSGNVSHNISFKPTPLRGAA